MTLDDFEGHYAIRLHCFDMMDDSCLLIYCTASWCHQYCCCLLLRRLP